MSNLKNIVSTVLGVEESAINDLLSPDNTESWDSFNSLMLVSEIERSYQLSFTMDEIKSTKTFKDIKDVLKKHGVIFKDEI